MLKLALMKKELKIYMKVTKLGGQSVWNVKLWTSVWTHYTVLICLSVSGLVSPWGECSPALHSAASTVRYRWCPLQCQSWAREEGRTTPSTPLDRKPWICIWVRSIMRHQEKSTVSKDKRMAFICCLYCAIQNTWITSRCVLFNLKMFSKTLLWPHTDALVVPWNPPQRARLAQHPCTPVQTLNAVKTQESWWYSAWQTRQIQEHL